jgi:alpha-mannosidase
MVTLPSSGITVHLIPHTHDDLGWLKTIDDYFAGTVTKTYNAAQGPVSVQQICEGILDFLLADPTRKFQYGEMGFWSKWYRTATAARRAVAAQLVASGQLIFVNGGMVQHDEACAHVADMIDQTTQGHQFLDQTYGFTPTVQWGIDPFGHSQTQYVISSEMGFDSFYYSRYDTADRAKRIATGTTEFIGRGSANRGAGSDLFIGGFPTDSYGPFNMGHYCFEASESGYSGGGTGNICKSPKLSDTFIDVSYLNEIYAWANASIPYSQGLDVAMFMGQDFTYQGGLLAGLPGGAASWGLNMDRLMKRVNMDGRVHMKISNMADYTMAKNRANFTWTVRTDDSFPYGSGTATDYRSPSYWTGYFSARPTLKRHIRKGSKTLFSARTLAVLSEDNAPSVAALVELWTAVSVNQHHDAVTGTAKQAVTDDYHSILGSGITSALAYMTNRITALSKTPLTLQTCNLLNMTVCPESSSSQNLVVIGYNPIARPRRMYFQLPFNYTNVSVVDADGVTYASELVPLQPNTMYTAGLIKNYTLSPNTLEFSAILPGLGYKTFFVVNGTSTVADSANSTATSIENNSYKLSFDPSAPSRFVVYDKTTNATIPWNISFSNYASSYPSDNSDNCYTFKTTSAVGGDVSLFDPSSAYMYAVGATSLYVNYRPGLISYWLRLRNGHIEVEWSATFNASAPGLTTSTMLRYNTNGYVNNSNGAMNTTWYTDSNGMDMLRRNFDSRFSYTINGLASASDSYAVPANFFPVATGAYIKDNSTAMAVLVDRAVACSSMPPYPGSLEFMINRPTTATTSGTSENVLETDSAGGAGSGFTRYGNPITATGKHYISFTSPSNIGRVMRPLQEKVYHEPEVFVSRFDGNITGYLASGAIPTLSFLNASLPSNVELFTLQALNASTVLLRLAHTVGAGDDAQYAVPVQVDLASIFNRFSISNIVQMNLAGIARSNSRSRLSWKADDYTSNNQYNLTGNLNGTVVTLDPLSIKAFQISITHIDYCAFYTNTCNGHGTCTNGALNYTCSCNTGYNGTLCDQQIDYCATSPCLSGGTCTNHVGYATCACTPGLYGMCDTTFNWCEPVLNTCANGATCRGTANNGYQCSCSAGWGGQNCTISDNKCDAAPCLNGGICASIGCPSACSYNCTCVNGFSGPQCATSPVTNCGRNAVTGVSSCGFTVLIMIGGNNTIGQPSSTTPPAADPSTNVWQWNSLHQNFTPAVDTLAHNLDSYVAYSGATFVGPGISFGQSWFGNGTGTRAVCILPAGKLSTGLLSSYWNDGQPGYVWIIQQLESIFSYSYSNTRVGAISVIAGGPDAMYGLPLIANQYTQSGTIPTYAPFNYNMFNTYDSLSLLENMIDRMVTSMRTSRRLSSSVVPVVFVQLPTTNSYVPFYSQVQSAITNTANRLFYSAVVPASTLPTDASGMTFVDPVTLGQLIRQYAAQALAQNTPPSTPLTIGSAVFWVPFNSPVGGAVDLSTNHASVKGSDPQWTPRYVNTNLFLSPANTNGYGWQIDASSRVVVNSTVTTTNYAFYSISAPSQSQYITKAALVTLTKKLSVQILSTTQTPTFRNFFLMGYDGSNLYCYINGGNVLYTTAVYNAYVAFNVTVYVPFHFACSYDGPTGATLIYINGRLVPNTGSVVRTGQAPLMSTSLGASYNSNGGTFTATYPNTFIVQHVVAYSYVMTAPQIRQLYELTLTQPHNADCQMQGPAQCNGCLNGIQQCFWAGVAAYATGNGTACPATLSFTQSCLGNGCNSTAAITSSSCSFKVVLVFGDHITSGLASPPSYWAVKPSYTSGRLYEAHTSGTGVAVYLAREPLHGPDGTASGTMPVATPFINDRNLTGFVTTSMQSILQLYPNSNILIVQASDSNAGSAWGGRTQASATATGVFLPTGTAYVAMKTKFNRAMALNPFNEVVGVIVALSSENTNNKALMTTTISSFVQNLRSTQGGFTGMNSSTPFIIIGKILPANAVSDRIYNTTINLLSRRFYYAKGLALGFPFESQNNGVPVLPDGSGLGFNAASKPMHSSSYTVLGSQFVGPQLVSLLTNRTDTASIDTPLASSQLKIPFSSSSMTDGGTNGCTPVLTTGTGGFVTSPFAAQYGRATGSYQMTSNTSTLVFPVGITACQLPPVFTYAIHLYIPSAAVLATGPYTILTAGGHSLSYASNLINASFDGVSVTVADGPIDYNSWDYISTVGLENDAWIQLVVSVSSSNLVSIWKEAILIATYQLAAPFTGAADIVIGSSTANAYQGLLRFFKVWPVGATSDQVKQLYSTLSAWDS